MYAQAAIKPNPLLRNGAYGIVMRGVQKCTRGCSSLRGKKRLPLCCIKLDTATDFPDGTGYFSGHMVVLLLVLCRADGKYGERVWQACAGNLSDRRSLSGIFSSTAF